MAPKSFSTRLLEDTVNLLINNQRDLRDPSLAEYYSVKAVGSKELQTAQEASAVYRATNGLPAVSQAKTFNDMSPSSGPAMFAEYLSLIGIEETFVEDLVAKDSSLVIRDTSVSSFLSKKEATGSVNSNFVTTLLSRVEVEPTQTLHLLENDPRDYADDVDLLNDRLIRIQKYVRLLIR